MHINVAIWQGLWLIPIWGGETKCDTRPWQVETLLSLPNSPLTDKTRRKGKGSTQHSPGLAQAVGADAKAVQHMGVTMKSVQGRRSPSLGAANAKKKKSLAASTTEEVDKIHAIEGITATWLAPIAIDEEAPAENLSQGPPQFFQGGGRHQGRLVPFQSTHEAAVPQSSCCPELSKRCNCRGSAPKASTPTVESANNGKRRQWPQIWS